MNSTSSASSALRSWKICPGWTMRTLPRSSSCRSGGSPRSTVSVPSSTTKTSSCTLSAWRLPRAPGGYRQMFARDCVMESERRAIVRPVSSPRGSQSSSSPRKIANPMETQYCGAYDRRAMPAVVVGREAELASLRDFVSDISDGAPTLALEGEAGMGKTTLWRSGVDAAHADGICVLQAQPAESETALSFSGLGDLLDPVLDEALKPLPAGQRLALSRALVLEDVEGPAPDAHAS